MGALILLSLLGSTISLYRITEVNRSLEAINRVSIPLSRLFVQLQSDSDVLKREMDRRLGQSHWNEPQWRPRPMPRWIEEVFEGQIERLGELVRKDHAWSSAESSQRWRGWVDELSQGFGGLKDESAKLHSALDQKDYESATKLYPQFNEHLEQWTRQLQWGVSEYERSMRQAFSLAQARVSELRTGLEIILAVVVLLSLLLLWLGERALRPLGELTGLAREITRRGLRKEDKALLPEISLARNDEVNQLAREFHRMATALLEREKTVDEQKKRLMDQNRQLREMGSLNENVLHSIKSVLIVTDLEGRITQCNPVAAEWLGGLAENLIGTSLLDWPMIRAFPGSESWLARLKENPEAWRIDPCTIDQRVFRGHLLPLKQEGAEPTGAIVTLEDLTEEMDLQERLRRAENLAAVGRMSAQVAHEVRNPLHSIGLEAEMALELAAKQGSVTLKQSLQSILAGVDRLEKITENYLKLSRLSAGKKTSLDLGEVLESVLATYAPVCEAQGVGVDWSRMPNSVLLVWGDRDLLEQVLGNLLRNALQALQGADQPRVSWTLGNAETGRLWLRIEDNGPGIAPEIRKKLFSPFVTTRAQGTGLGLSFVKKVLEDHGGTIELIDRAPGQGACFELTLPPMEAGANEGVELADAPAFMDSPREH